MIVGWEAAGATDVGRVRGGNEDTLRMDPARGVFLVADGMGGHAAGEVASAVVADAVMEALADGIDHTRGDAVLDLLSAAVARAHAAILDCCRGDPRTRGMGTTLTACVLDPAGVARVAHVGDSRLYRLHDGTFEQLTRDHTWVQREVDAGRLTPAAVRHHPLSHILTRVLTDDAVPEADLLSGPVAPGDLLLLATDGLYNMLEDPEIARLTALDRPLPARVDALIDAANRAGGADNVTVVLVRILPVEA